MWRRASCEQQLDTRNPVHIPEPGTGTVPICGRIPIPLDRAARLRSRVRDRVRNGIRRGNPTKPGDAVWRSRKSFLFSMSVRVPWNPLAGRYGLEREEHRSCGGVGILQYGP
ncbi:hypothetical protein Phum_PHUM269490 [Pediculus humanus corporis]|uniref:Uncharacterized protein n=1 Tax=Pediculus humanus subsp. corporis TaxID=121224 RepID=E0VKU9_PEDHC|nr:hypothetical protein Phum_PHUM269490 [Pediculus humanus corporis]